MMQIQWPLLIFTLFVCLSSGVIGAQALLSYKGKGETLAKTSVYVSFIALVIGGLASFLHLQHWERMFNGFGHITSGITQELIGIVVLAVLLIVWFVLLRQGKQISKALSIVTVIISVLMVLVMANSYNMEARPAWGIGLDILYLANAALLGAVALWVIAAIKKSDVASSLIKATFITSIVQIGAYIVYLIFAGVVQLSAVGYYFDPTHPAVAPINPGNLAGALLGGSGAVFFWIALIIGAVAVGVLSYFAKKKDVEKTTNYAYIAIALTAIGAITFRCAVYIIGYTIFPFYG